MIEKFNFQPIVSINVSKEHFINENFIEEYVEIANKYNVDRSKIDLEITESAIIDRNVDTIKILNNIKEKVLLFLLMTLEQGILHLACYKAHQLM